MRAAVFHRVGEPLRLERLEAPTPAPGEILLRVRRCGICGSDLHMTELAESERPGGFVFGHEYAGEVVAIGQDVTGTAVGDRVAVMPLTGCGACEACRAGNPAYCADRQLKQGGYAEYALGRAREAVVLPDGLDWTDGALLEPLAVGLHGVRLAQLRPGTRVLVIGAGPIGLAATFWARRLGAGPIAVTARSARNAARAEAMGATAFAAPGAVVDVLGGPPEVVIECTGAPGLIAEAVGQVARGGRIVVLGICWGPDRIAPREAIRKECALLFSAFFTLAEFREARDVLAAGHLEPRAMVTHTIGLDALPAAFEALRRPTDQCKVMVAP